MKTIMYKNYTAFLAREDKTLNGVSEDFAREHPEVLFEDTNNIACFNCVSCNNCIACEKCTNCDDCVRCNYCDDCIDCYSCTDITNFTSLADEN